MSDVINTELEGPLAVQLPVGPLTSPTYRTSRVHRLRHEPEGTVIVSWICPGACGLRLVYLLDRDVSIAENTPLVGSSSVRTNPL